MALLGNKLQQAYSVTAKDTFNGDGSTVAFTLSRPSRTNDVEVFVENVQQEPTVAYAVSGTTLTFTEAPSSGTGNIYVIHRTQATQSLTVNTDDIVDGSITSAKLAEGAVTDPTPAVVSDTANTSTGYFALPVGTDAQRPSTPLLGMIRANSSSNIPEWYDPDAGTWKAFNIGKTYDIQYLSVAGGAGGGGNLSGGGGGGGYLAGTESVQLGTQLVITVGAGGAGTVGTQDGTTGLSGADSSIYGFTAGITSIGGGGGGGGDDGTTPGSGGSGGGGSGYAAGTNFGSGTVGQGNDGAAGGLNNPNYPGGGGGGAGAAGSSPATASDAGGDGGIGVTNSITGTAYYWAGGGGGGSYVDTNGGGNGGNGGAGGGGCDAGTPGSGGSGYNAGSSGSGTTGGAGGANTGGGGGGAGHNSGSGTGGNGGSGIVVLRMPTADYSGITSGSPTVTTDGTDTILIYTSSGSYTS